MDPTATEQDSNAGRHTTGPWVVQQLNHADGDLWLQIGHFRDGVEVGPVADITVPEAFTVARLRWLVTPEAEQWANARLIAAAPDLLAELRRLEAELTSIAADLSHSDETREWADSRARSAFAAIRKAQAAP